MLLLIEMAFLRIIHEVTRLRDLADDFNRYIMFPAGNRLELVAIERPGLGDDGRFFPPPYVNGVSQPCVVFDRDR
jgi:hypothetical protein